jgi:hypothetical protein
MSDKVKSPNYARRILGAVLTGTLGATVLSSCGADTLTLKRPAFAYISVENGHTSLDGCFVDYVGRARTIGTIEWLDQGKTNTAENLSDKVTTPGALTFVDFGTGDRHPLPESWLTAERVYKPGKGNTFTGNRDQPNTHHEEILCHQEVAANALPVYMNKQFASLVLYNGYDQFTSLDGPINSSTHAPESGLPITTVDGYPMPIEVRRHSLQDLPSR